MTISGVNFLSFGKRERILKRTHKKYLSYICIVLILIGGVSGNILINRKTYSNLLNSKQSKIISDLQVEHKNSVDIILLLLDSMKLFIENIEYTLDNISINVRIADKKYIYSIVDNLIQANLYIKSYEYMSENDGLYLYKIDIYQ